VWDLPPEDLKALNEKKLKALGAPEDSIKTFLENRHFTPTTQTAFVLVLEELKGISGLPGAVTVATAADSEEDARFFIGSVKILSAYHRSSPIHEIGIEGSVILARSGKETTIVPAAIDYVSWTDQISEFAQRDHLGDDRLVLLSGKFSPTARKAFTILGWHIQENFP
jgi:hypothetical protein